MNRTISAEFKTASRELLLALLGELPYVSGIWEERDSIKVYFEENHRRDFDEFLRTLKIPAECRVRAVKEENWNTLWEKNFSPITIGEFCYVRAPFHEPMEDLPYEIIISPEMAFGTGHHETTYLMMSRMQHLPVMDSKVLDFGAGTGILSILAEKLGAREVHAIDIQPEAIDNMKVNSSQNRCSTITGILGSLDTVKHNSYDAILANINRNVLLDNLTDLSALLNKGGFLLLSGILEDDKDQMREGLNEAGLQIMTIDQRGEWLCMSAGRETQVISYE